MNIWVNSSNVPCLHDASSPGWITNADSKGKEDWSGPIEELNLNLWYYRKEWEGAYAPRLLFDTLTGAPGDTRSLLYKVMEYRGINLAYLFEGDWIALIWPKWFAELAAWDDFAKRHPGATVILEDADPVRILAATQCVQVRHPTVEFRIKQRFSKTWIKDLSRKVTFHWTYRALRAAKHFMQSVWRRPKRNDASGEYAFLPCSSKIAPHILPVLMQWEKQHPDTALVICRGNKPSFNNESKIKWKALNSILSPGLVVRALQGEAKIRRTWYEERSSGRLDELSNWHGWDFRPLVLTFLDNRFQSLFRLILDIIIAEKFIQKYGIKAVIVPHDGGSGIRRIVAAARLAGVKSVGLQYGLLGASAETGEPFEDHLCVYGERVRECYLQRGANPDKLNVVGSVYYDQLDQSRNNRERVRFEIARKFKINTAKRWVLAATWPLRSTHVSAFKVKEMSVLSEAISQLDDVQLIFKLHPSDHQEGQIEREQAERFGIKDYIIVTDVRINDQIILAADAMVSNYSSVGLLAVALKTPLVILDLKGVASYPKRTYVDDGVALFADNPVDLSSSLREVLADSDVFWKNREEARARFIRTHLFNSDGRAAQRICDLLERIT